MDSNRLMGIVLIALGALLLLDWLNIPYLVTILGIVLIVVGVLILMGKAAGGKVLAVVALVLGILIVFSGVEPFGKALAWIGDLLVTVIAIILIVLGVLKLMNR